MSLIFIRGRRSMTRWLSFLNGRHSRWRECDGLVLIKGRRSMGRLRSFPNGRRSRRVCDGLVLIKGRRSMGRLRSSLRRSRRVCALLLHERWAGSTKGGWPPMFFELRRPMSICGTSIRLASGFEKSVTDSSPITFIGGPLTCSASSFSTTGFVCLALIVYRDEPMSRPTRLPICSVTLSMSEFIASVLASISPHGATITQVCCDEVVLSSAASGAIS